MDRLFHLKETYPKNLKACESYGNVEFVLLDYGGKDEVGKWVSENLSSYLDSGMLRFLRTDEPRYWVAAHAKNIAHRAAGGDILCNLDSDITMPNGFCEFVYRSFKNKRIVMSFASEDANDNNGCAGFIGATREDFYSVNGYDESINLGWGYDDTNYQFRVRMHNRLELFVAPPILSCIAHSNEVRTVNCQLKDIRETMDLSKNICEDAAIRQDYVANKGSEWGMTKISQRLPS
jgi:hypothetical protein